MRLLACATIFGLSPFKTQPPFNAISPCNVQIQWCHCTPSGRCEVTRSSRFTRPSESNRRGARGLVGGVWHRVGRNNGVVIFGSGRGLPGHRDCNCPLTGLCPRCQGDLWRGHLPFGSSWPRLVPGALRPRNPRSRSRSRPACSLRPHRLGRRGKWPGFREPRFCGRIRREVSGNGA